MARVFRYLKDSLGVELNAVTKTATFNSEALELSGLDIFGIRVKAASVTGTLDIKVQVSHDGGTTWWDTYGDAENSATQAKLAQITAAIETEEHWPVWDTFGVLGPDDLEAKVRFVFTMASTPSMVLTVILVGRSYGRPVSG